MTTSHVRWEASQALEAGFAAQNPYANGVTVWRNSRWLGNGFGNSVEYVAVSPSGWVIGSYVSDRYRISANVLGIPVHSQYHRSGGHRYVVATRLTRWRRAVRGLTSDQVVAADQSR